MVKILLAISILVTALTAGLGFMTKTKVQGLKDTLNDTQKSERTAKDALGKAQGELKTAKDDLTAATKAVEDQKTQMATLESSLTAAKADAAKATADLEANKARIAELEERAKSAPTSSAPATNADSPQTVLLQGELANVKKELEEARQVQETLRNREKESAEKLADANRLVEGYRKPVERAGITGRVVAVNPGWNFVVVDVGDRRGATVNSPLLVTREGQIVARLKITSVEPSTSIADVVPGSLPRGQSIQPGDRVVFAGRQPAAPAPATTTPGGAPAPEAPNTARAL